ncbi:MAG: hypothetical protein HYZ37_02545 [Candidatus Solibacter usitatus]|nr:hypothetical protein [Candidatus Solibacter usitatus]
MSALPLPTYGLEKLFLFPVFQTREAYFKATGKEAPAYDETKDIKSWFDPNALENPRRKIVYDRVLAIAANKAPIPGPDGKPMLEPMVIDRELAATVNIPPKGPGIVDAPQTGYEIPVPLRAVDAEEELYFRFGGTVAVKNKALFPAPPGEFTDSDRTLLRAIANKLGVV